MAKFKKSSGEKHRMKKIWRLTDNLLDLTGQGDYWTIADACEGVQVFGGTGSGKTSAPLKTIAKTFLLNQFGGLVLCAKIDEAEEWEKYAKETGRENDIIRLSEKSFDFITYEATRGENIEVENIVNCFMEVAEISNNDTGGSNEAYWLRAGKQLMRNIVSLLMLSEEKITLNNIAKLVTSAPKNEKAAADPKWRKTSYCCQLFQRIYETGIKEEQKQNYELAKNYLLNEFPEMDSRTRGNIVSFFTTLADGFLRGKINQIFCSGKVDITPEMCSEGKIILVDLSIKEYLEIGKYSAVIMKYMVQRSLERRKCNNKDLLRPVFIFADESHYFTTAKDQEFQTTARSAKGCTVFATQNYPNYLKALGNKKATVDSLLGNLQTKIICQNGDPETNKWAAEMMGKEIVKRKGTSESVQLSALGGNVKKNKSTSEHKDFIVDPIEFSHLAKGGKDYNYKVESILWKGGHIWKNDLCFLQLKFNQLKQATKSSGIFYELLRISVYYISWIIAAGFIYYMYSKQLNNILVVKDYYLSGIKKVYINGAIILCVFGAIYTLASCIKYIGVIFKSLIIAALLLSASFLYRFSPGDYYAIALGINIYLVGFFFYILFLNETLSLKKWFSPVINYS
jgi:hypothetical protein